MSSSMQIQERLRSHAAAASAAPPGMTWQAQLAECLLILHKAELHEGDTCTPALSLLFEDAAFSKLSHGSVKVKRAKACLQRLQMVHAAELQGKDTSIGSDFFRELLAAFVVCKVQQLKSDLCHQAMRYAELQALMPALAERAKEQQRILKALERVVRGMDAKVAALKGWLTGPFNEPALLPQSLVVLSESCHEWDLHQMHRGVFPWDANAAAPGVVSDTELFAVLELHVLEFQRAEEELVLLEKEKGLTLNLYEVQITALEKALESMSQASIVDDPDRFDAECTAAERRARGIQHVLQQKLLDVQLMRAHARSVFHHSAAVSPLDAVVHASMHTNAFGTEIDDSASEDEEGL